MRGEIAASKRMIRGRASEGEGQKEKGRRRQKGMRTVAGCSKACLAWLNCDAERRLPSPDRYHDDFEGKCGTPCHMRIHEEALRLTGFENTSVLE